MNRVVALLPRWTRSFPRTGGALNADLTVERIMPARQGFNSVQRDRRPPRPCERRLLVERSRSLVILKCKRYGPLWVESGHRLPTRYAICAA